MIDIDTNKIVSMEACGLYIEESHARDILNVMGFDKEFIDSYIEENAQNERIDRV